MTFSMIRPPVPTWTLCHSCYLLKSNGDKSEDPLGSRSHSRDRDLHWTPLRLGLNPESTAEKRRLLLREDLGQDALHLVSQWSKDRILRKSLLVPQLTGQPLRRCPQTSTHQAEVSEATPPHRSPGWEADAVLKRESWREEHRKLSFLPPTQVLPQACSTQSGAEGGSGHVYFWNSKPASCLIPVPMAPQCGDDDWCRFRKVGVLMPGTPCDENATLQQTASMSPLLSLHSAWCFWMFGHEVLHYGRTLSCRVYHRKPQNPNVSPWSPIISHNQTFQSTSWLSL
jgi:hypothetical protein